VTGESITGKFRVQQLHVPVAADLGENRSGHD
jgi:hypothetical protein